MFAKGSAIEPAARIVGGRAWPSRRLRSEPDREGQELWLAISKPETPPYLAKLVLHWAPVIAPPKLMFYRGDKMFLQLNGNCFINGLAAKNAF